MSEIVPENQENNEQINDAIEKEPRKKRQLTEAQLEGLKKGRENLKKKNDEKRPIKEEEKKQNKIKRYQNLKQNRAKTEEEVLKAQLLEEKRKIEQEKKLNKKIDEGKRILEYILEESSSESDNDEDVKKIVITKKRADKLINKAIEEFKKTSNQVQPIQPIIECPKKLFLQQLNKGRDERLTKNKWIK